MASSDSIAIAYGAVALCWWRLVRGSKIDSCAADYPGVYIEELSSDVHGVTGVTTSVAAFVGSFGRGVADRAVQLLSIAEVRTDGAREVVVASETFRNLTVSPGAPNHAPDVVNAQSRLVQLTAEAGAKGRPAASSGRLTGTKQLDPFALPADKAEVPVKLGEAAATATLDYGGTPPTSYAAFAPRLEAALRAAAAALPVALRPLLAGAAVSLEAVGPDQGLSITLGRAGGFGAPVALELTGPAAVSLGLAVVDTVSTPQATGLANGKDGGALPDGAMIRPVPLAASWAVPRPRPACTRSTRSTWSTSCAWRRRWRCRTRRSGRSNCGHRLCTGAAGDGDRRSAREERPVAGRHATMAGRQ